MLNAPSGKPAAGRKARTRSRRYCEAVRGKPHGLEPAEQLRLCCRKLFLGQDALVPELG